MVGPGEMDAYHRQLKQLQTEALTADDVPTGLAMAQTHIRTIEHRAALVKEARDRTLMPKGFVQRLKSVLGI
jgi:hypothetical protein